MCMFAQRESPFPSFSLYIVPASLHSLSLTLQVNRIGAPEREEEVGWMEWNGERTEAGAYKQASRVGRNAMNERVFKSLFY
jgi:hypothetical protein